MQTPETKRRLIKLPAVCEATGLSRSGVYKRMGENTFPKSVPLGGRAVAWVESEVDDWVTQQIESRSGEVAA